MRDHYWQILTSFHQKLLREVAIKRKKQMQQDEIFSKDHQFVISIEEIIINKESWL